MNIVDVVSGLGIVRRAGEAAQAPGLGRRYRTVRKERVAWQATHEVDELGIRARCIDDTHVERVERRRVPGCVGLGFDAPPAASLPVGIDGRSNLPQPGPQFLLPAARVPELDVSHRGPCQYG